MGTPAHDDAGADESDAADDLCRDACVIGSDQSEQARSQRNRRERADARLLVHALALPAHERAQNSGNAELFPLVVLGGLVTIVPLIALFLILQRYWRSGLLLGSVAN